MALLTEQQLDQRIGELPALSPVVGELFTLLNATSVDYGEVERKLGREPVLAGRVLRLSNSSFFGFAGRIGSLREACLVLGSRTLRQTLLAAAVHQQLAVPPGLLDGRRLWQHTLATGAIAKALAPVVGADAEQAFLCGLLHDLGRLALAAYFPAEYERVLDYLALHGGLRLAAERTVLGFGHGTVGGKLAQKWHLPEALVLAIGRHHHPVPAESGHMMDLVHLADVLAHALGYGPEADDRVPPLLPDAWARLGLRWDRLEEMLPMLDRAAGEAARFEF